MLAQLLCGGIIALVTNFEQAKIAESAATCRISISDQPSRPLGVYNMVDPALLKCVKQFVDIPIMSRSRVGHFMEAMILESLDVDYIDESGEMAVADEEHFINKHNFSVTFVCGCGNSSDAFRRFREGTAMVRINQGDFSGSDNIVKMVVNVRSVAGNIGDVRIS